MQIFVKLLVGRTILLDVQPSETVLSVKRRLFICGKKMFNHQTISDCNIFLESTVHVAYQKARYFAPPMKDVMIHMNFIGILSFIWANYYGYNHDV